MPVPLARFSGAFRVSRGGSVVAEGASGLLDAGSGEPCTAAGRFAACSVSKSFLAATVLLLAERGTLRLEDPVGRFWPATPPEWEAMRIEHLLAHTSGLPHWQGLAGLDLADPPGAGEILRQAAALPLLAAPGEQWAYSGVGYLLAAAIVEAAAGEPYSAFVSGNVFAPLGMASTISGRQPGAPAASGHRNGLPVPSVPGLIALPGTGDAWTTVGDLIRYGEALPAGELLSASSWRSMGLPHAQIEAPGKPDGKVTTSGYGYGTYIGGIAGRPALFHHGDNPGFRSLLAWLPASETTIAVLSNDDSVALDDVAAELAAM